LEVPTSRLPTDDIKADNSCASEPDKSKNSRHKKFLAVISRLNH
jgi:hypothetical protein